MSKRVRWRRLVGWFAVLVGLCIAVVFGIQRRLLFPRHLVVAPEAAERGVDGLEKLSLSTDQGDVEAWFLPAYDAEGPAPVVIFAHGNGEVIDHWPRELEPYRRRGISVLLPEYRGYGRSAGDPSQERITADFVRWYDTIVGRDDVDPQRVIFHGRSLGGGAVCALAGERKPTAMILQSTFLSVSDVAWWVPGMLILDAFDNLDCVRELDVPILVIHGRHDTLIPPSHGKELAAAASDAELVLYNASHNDCPPPGAPYWDDIARLLSRAGIGM